MGSNVNNDECFDFRDKYTLPMYLEFASNWYLLILENHLYKIFYKCDPPHEFDAKGESTRTTRLHDTLSVP